LTDILLNYLTTASFRSETSQYKCSTISVKEFTRTLRFLYFNTFCTSSNKLSEMMAW